MHRILLSRRGQTTHRLPPHPLRQRRIPILHTPPHLLPIQPIAQPHDSHDDLFRRNDVCHAADDGQFGSGAEGTDEEADGVSAGSYQDVESVVGGD